MKMNVTNLFLSVCTKFKGNNYLLSVSLLVYLTVMDYIFLAALQWKNLSNCSKWNCWHSCLS